MKPIEDIPNDIRELLPEWKDIPDEFKRDGNKWVELFNDMFFNDCRADYKAKEGIDEKRAMKHIRAAMQSRVFEHSHKEAGVAYLLAQWFDKFNVTKL
jgi:hypothetical protein